MYYFLEETYCLCYWKHACPSVRHSNLWTCAVALDMFLFLFGSVVVRRLNWPAHAALRWLSRNAALGSISARSEIAHHCSTKAYNALQLHAVGICAREREAVFHGGGIAVAVWLSHAHAAITLRCCLRLEKSGAWKEEKSSEERKRRRREEICYH
jgi:hypothetical protein